MKMVLKKMKNSKVQGIPLFVIFITTRSKNYTPPFNGGAPISPKLLNYSEPIPNTDTDARPHRKHP
jgi:hypothetical protein